ncbi:MAG: DUF3466 family protein [Acidobacteriia bacterium]|nr:DUF3466 family protein [Terriglobia bacterium]
MDLPRCILIIIFCCSVQSPGWAQPAEDSIGPTFTTIHVPGSKATVLLGINSLNQMVGYYYNTGNGDNATGFLLSDGNFAFFSYPESDETLAVGVNDSGLISGYAFTGASTSVGFLYDGVTFTTIELLDNGFTEVTGINNAGSFVGGRGHGDILQSFERVGTRFRDVTPPGAWLTAAAHGVNNFDEVVGSVIGGYSLNNGFAYIRGKFYTIAFPDAYDTSAWGVNDSGIIVGSYTGCTPLCAIHGFARMKGKYLSLDYPGATLTFANGINNSGQIVGSYTFSDQEVYYGFVTSPITATDFERPGCCVIDPNWQEH